MVAVTQKKFWEEFSKTKILKNRFYSDSEDFEDEDKNKKLKLTKQNKKRKLQHRDVSEGEYSAATGKNKKQKLTKRQNSDDEDDEKYWIGTMLKSPGFFKKYQFSRQTKSLTFSNWCRIFTRSKAMLLFLFLGSQFLFSFTSSSSISIPGLGGSVDKPNLTSFVKCDIDAKINLVKLV